MADVQTSPQEDTFVCCDQVLYWTEDSRGSVMGRIQVNSNITSQNVKGLRANTLYFAAVRAYNTAGPGPSSAPVNVTTKKSREFPFPPGFWVESQMRVDTASSIPGPSLFPMPAFLWASGDT